MTRQRRPAGAAPTLAGQPEISVDGGGDTLGAAALSYAEHGWPVFPLVPGGKSPVIPKSDGGNGFKDATCDPDTVRRWWRRWPRANVAVPTGLEFDVLDVDVRHSGDGWTSFEELRIRGLLTGCCGVARTRNGGGHYFFPRSGTTCRAYGLLDLKAVGGYVVLPPSRVPSDVPEGPGRYTWIDPYRPGHGAPLNASAVERALRPATSTPRRLPNPSRGQSHGLAAVVLRAPEGSRNNLLFWAMCRALEADLDTRSIEHAARVAGLPDEEITRTRTSAVARVRR